jgi:hypothetical protein
VGAFRASGALPCEGVSALAALQGIDWSDQWSYWESGYPGVMVTDTALFRNPHYHDASDVPETLDFERLARAVDGLGGGAGAGSQRAALTRCLTARPRPSR